MRQKLISLNQIVYMSFFYVSLQMKMYGGCFFLIFLNPPFKHFLPSFKYRIPPKSIDSYNHAWDIRWNSNDTDFRSMKFWEVNDGQQFHWYHCNEQSPLNWTQKRPWYTYIWHWNFMTKNFNPIPVNDN